MLLWGHYVIPNWHLRKQRLLYWDKFSRPAKPSRIGTSVNWWWFDPAKAAKLEERRKTEPPQTALEGGGTPGIGTVFAVLGGLLIAGYFVFRTALQRRPQA